MHSFSTYSDVVLLLLILLFFNHFGLAVRLDGRTQMHCSVGQRLRAQNAFTKLHKKNN